MREGLRSHHYQLPNRFGHTVLKALKIPCSVSRYAVKSKE